VEVVSPDQPRRDYRDKKQVYEAHGVKGYWIIDPERDKVEVWHLKEDFYQLAGAYAGNQFAASVLLAGFKVRVDRLFAPRW
jgi:Uma2 family endonuclease